MALSPSIRKVVEAKLQSYCENRVPPDLREKIRLGFSFKGDTVTLSESRPDIFEPSRWNSKPVAMFHFDPETREWRLYWADRNSQWHLLPGQRPAKEFDVLIGLVDQDPDGCFWG